MALPGMFDPALGTPEANPLDPTVATGQANTPPRIDLSAGVGLTGADHYNIQRLTRAQTYLSGSGAAGYPDLSGAVALSSTDWATMDSHIQALGGSPGYGLGIGQLLDHLSSPGADKTGVANLATLQRTMISEGFLPPGTPINGLWDANSSAAFKAMEDYNYNVANQGQKAGGASIFQFLHWMGDTLPSGVGQALVGTAKFLFGGIAHTLTRQAIEAAHAPGSWLGHTVLSALAVSDPLGILPDPLSNHIRSNPEVQQALAQHGLAGGGKGQIEDLTTALALIPILKGAGVLQKGVMSAGASALGEGLGTEGASALIQPAEGAVSKGLAARGVRTLVGRSIAKDVAGYAADPAAVSDMLSEFATKPMSLRGLGQGFLNAADWTARVKSTPLGQLVTAGLNAATQTSIGERGVANVTSGTILPNIHLGPIPLSPGFKLGKEERSALGQAIDNTPTLGHSWHLPGPLGALGNPLDLSAFVWAPTKALPIGGKPTIGDMALSMDRITPTSDLAPLIRNTGNSREDLVTALRGEPQLKQFMRYIGLQASVNRDATLWLADLKDLKPGADGWEAALREKSQEIQTTLKADPGKMEAAISSASARDMLDQIKLIFSGNDQLLARRGQAAPVLGDWADATTALGGVTASDASVDSFVRGARLWTDANQEALNHALEPFFNEQGISTNLPRMTDPEGRVLTGERAGGGSVAGSHYTFGEQIAGRLGEVLGPDATIAVRRADNALGSAQQLASWKVVWDRLGSVTSSIESRLAEAAAGEPNGLIEMPKRAQIADLQAAGFTPQEVDLMRDPRLLGLTGAKMTPQQATNFLSNLNARVSELKTTMNKYNPETAVMDPRQLSTYANHLTMMAPRDVTLADAALHQTVTGLGYQPVALHPGAITLNDVGAGTADGLSNAARVAPIQQFLGIGKLRPEDLQYMRTQSTQNEMYLLTKTDPSIGQNGKEVMARVYDAARAASDAGIKIPRTNLQLERSIVDLRQLSPSMLQKYGGFTAEQAWNVYGGIRRGAAFGFDISKPIQTLRNLGEALQYNGIPGMEDAIRTLVSLKPNTGVPWVDGVAGHVLNLPDDLARLRDFVQFSMSPQFTMAKAFKTKVLRRVEGLPFDYQPLNRIKELADNSGNAEEFTAQFNRNYRNVMGESRGNAYASLMDNPDFGVRNPGSGIFGHTNEHGLALDSWHLAQQIRAERNIAADVDLSSGQYQAIRDKVNGIYGYGARSGLEKSANYIFFPLSFDLKVGKALSGWMLQNPARVLMTTMGLQAYDQINGPDNKVGGFIDRYLPMLTELNKLNFFSGGFHTQFTYAGGRNTTLYNMGKDVNALFHQDPRLAAYVPISVSDNDLPNALGIMANLVPAWRQLQSMSKSAVSQGNVLTEGGAEQWQVDNYFQEVKALKQAVSISLGNAGLKPSFSTLTDPFGNPNSKISPEFFNQVQAELGKIEAKYPAGASFAKAQSADYQTRANALDELMRKPVKSRAEASMLYFAAAYYTLQAQAQSTAKANNARGRAGRELYQSIAGAMAQGTTPPTLPGDLDATQVAQLRSLALQLSKQSGSAFADGGPWSYNHLFKSELGPLTVIDQAPGAISLSGSQAA